MSDLDEVYQLISKAIEKKCDNITISGTIKAIGTDGIVVLRVGTKRVVCSTIQDLTNDIQIGDTLTVSGSICLTDTIGLVASQLVLTNSDTEMEQFNKVKTFLLYNKKCKAELKKLRSRSLPPIKNIALIANQANSDNIRAFSKLFCEQCYGTLYTYYLDDINIGKDIQRALEYFRKYHDIDLVCFLFDQLTLSQLLALSIKDNIRYLFDNVKERPYSINIGGTLTEPPLTTYVTNAQIDSIPLCIKLISEQQHNIRSAIATPLSLGQKRLDSIVARYQLQLNELAILMTEFAVTDNQLSKPIRLLQLRVIEELDKQKTFLHKVQLMVMQSIIDDPTVQKKIENKISSKNNVTICRTPNDDIDF